MIVISHRGNLNGPNKDKENSVQYIATACNQGYHVECDWWYDGAVWLGHDEPTYKLSKFELEQLIQLKDYLWCHAKNENALEWLLNGGWNCFYHDSDDMVLTSKKYIWTFPGKSLTQRSIAVMPETANGSVYGSWDFSKAAGVCTDYPESIKSTTPA